MIKMSENKNIHICEGTQYNNIGKREEGWTMDDLECETIINYCPFCGVKLE